MSNPQQPKPEWPLPEDDTGRDEMKDSLLGRTQEVEHVQSRFSNLQGPGSQAGQPAPGAPGAATTGTVSVHQVSREKVGTFLPSTEGGPWLVASVLRLGAAGFGLMAAVLFVLPELSGSFQTPTAAEAAIPTTYNTIAPAFDDPPPPSADLEKVITEQTTDFDGASILVVDAEPASVSVRVDGNDQGNTPVSLTLDCLPGKPIKVEISKRGYERAQHTTFCRADTMIKLFARMRKAEKGTAAPKGKK